jgi:hypothetical protein
MLTAIGRASSFVSIAFGRPVSPIDRIKLDATCAKCIFDSFRHVAPVGFGPLVCWNSPYGYVDIVQGAVRQGWDDLKKGVHVALLNRTLTNLVHAFYMKSGTSRDLSADDWGNG